jgi:DNA invertase Pin-like site-specific DNA recombinase
VGLHLLAKRQGVYTGGKARLDRARVKQLAKDGVGPTKIARELRMAHSSVYRLHPREWQLASLQEPFPIG